MPFSSTVFLFLFLPLVLALHALVPRRWRNGVLLASSLLFYAWGEGLFVVVMLLTVLGNHWLGLLVSRAPGTRASRRWVLAAIVLDMGLLASFKYVDFALANLNVLLSRWGLPPFEVTADSHLPIGISFFTFQALSYVVDVYRGDARAQRSPVRTALYVSMFPQLVAGPIVRYRQIAEQLGERTTSLERFALGVRRFALGLGKKVLLAAPLQGPADRIFDVMPAGDLSVGLVLLGVSCYTLQLYFDFSGYSDMAVGLGHMFGFRLPENFDHPFVARSIREIWRRWHITLTTWFRDYVYIPLGGNRRGALRTGLNLCLVFVLVGLWHGARWGFVLFGLYHGVAMLLERGPWGRALERAPRVLQHVYTMGIWMFGLVLFRATSLERAGELLAALRGPVARGGVSASDLMTNQVLLALVVGVLASVPTLALLRARLEALSRPRLLSALSFAGVSAVLFLCALAMAASTHQAFIYFRF